MPDSAIAIKTRDLSKQFEPSNGWRRLARRKPVAAVRDVTLAVREGELFGLLGPNGAGKTTLVKMLCTLILPSKGSAIVAGHPLQDAAAIRAAVGLVVTDERSFYWRLTGRENLHFFAAMYRLHGSEAERRVQDVLERVDMVQRADQRFSDYSSGMRQRMAIARSLLHRPRILFLDEPTRSLDPAATVRLHDLLRDLVDRQGVTTFLITHDLAEAEKLCDRVAVMHRGRIRALDSPAGLRERLARRLQYTVRVAHLPGDAMPWVQQVAPDARVRAVGDFHHLTFEAAEADGMLTRVLDYLRFNDVTIHSIETKAPTLEEVFTHFTDAAND